MVAERLFSPPESPALPRDKPKRRSRTLGPEEAIPKNVVTPSHPQLLNMAAQLLEQAEGRILGTGQVLEYHGDLHHSSNSEKGVYTVFYCAFLSATLFFSLGEFFH